MHLRITEHRVITSDLSQYEHASFRRRNTLYHATGPNNRPHNLWLW